MLLDAEIFDEAREGSVASLEVAKSGPGPAQDPFRCILFLAVERGH